MLNDVSTLYIRLMSGSNVGRLAVPKFFGSCPARFISHPAVRYTHPSSPCGTPSRFRSVQETLVVSSASGLNRFEKPVVPACSYRPRLNFSAVFWLPNRSYTTPPRGAMLVQLGMSIGPKLRTDDTK